jgi:apolipoprotein N-acyltransferase
LSGNVAENAAQSGMIINISAVLDTLRKFLSLELTIAEWIGTAILAGIPYLVIGVTWSATHTDQLNGLTGVDRAVSFLGSIANWPVLLFSDVCMA